MTVVHHTSRRSFLPHQTYGFGCDSWIHLSPFCCMTDSGLLASFTSATLPSLDKDSIH